MSEEEKQGRNLVREAKRIVVKVGTSTITYENGRMNMRNMDRLARAIADLMNSGREVVLVTSGAIGVGVGCLDLPERPREMRDKQAVAAVGQCELMNVYSRCFAEYSRVVAQILLTKDGIDDPITRSNISNTMESLLEKGILPVVNENDTVSTAEIPHAGTFGDNDTLSALVARVVNADLLIILSDIDAVYDSNPRENPDAKRRCRWSRFCLRYRRYADKDPGDEYADAARYCRRDRRGIPVPDPGRYPGGRRHRNPVCSDSRQVNFYQL